MNFPLRPDLTPAIAQTAIEMADIDPMAAMRHISHISEWENVQKYVLELVQSIPEEMRSQEVLHEILKDEINAILYGSNSAPVDNGGYTEPQQGLVSSEDNTPMQPEHTKKIKAEKFLTGSPRKKRESAEGYLGVGR
jgi:hypothetical protein